MPIVIVYREYKENSYESHVGILPDLGTLVNLNRGNSNLMTNTKRY